MSKDMRIICILAVVLGFGLCAPGAAQDNPNAEGAVGAGDDKAQALIDQAHLFNSLGRHAEAEDAYRRALDARLARSPADDPKVSDILMNLALEVSNLGRYAEAKALFDQAAPLVTKSPDPFAEPRFASYLAIDAINQGHFAEARDFGRRATALRRALTIGGPRGSGGLGSRTAGLYSAMLAEGELAHSLMIEAQASYHLEDLVDAEVAASAALDIIERIPGLPAWWQPRAMTILGEIETRGGRLEKAEKLLQEGAQRSRDLFGDSHPTALAYFALGRYFKVAGRYPEAREMFRRGLKIMGLPQQRAISLTFPDIADFLSLSLEMASRQGDRDPLITEEAIQVLQRLQADTVKAVGSRTAIRYAAADPLVSAAVADLQRAEAAAGDVRLQLAEEVEKAPEQKDSQRQRQLAERYRDLSGQAADLRRQLGRDFPGFQALLSPQPPTVADIRSRLGDDEAFLTIAIGPTFGLAGLVTPTAMLAERIDLSAATVDDMVRQLRDGMVIRGGKVSPYDHALANRLYRKLFGPLEPALSNIRHIDLAVSGALSSFPLAALEIETPATDGGRPVWLIDRFALSNWPSAGAFHILHAAGRNSRASRAFFGLGAPRFEAPWGGGGASGLCRGDRPFPSEALASLPALPDSATELARVAALFQAGADDVLTGDQATEINLRRHSLDQYRVLYFATHGLLANELRCQPEPGLALAPPPVPATTRSQDGLLEASEIAGLRLDADLVVLSACNTAVNDGRFGGDGLVSLADVFFHAGARSVLASHWSVPSNSTMTLMDELFSRHAASPLAGYAESLRQAQLVLINNPKTQHPVHWAGFSLIGNTATSIEQSKRD